jgi:hypothetical protein
VELDEVYKTFWTLAQVKVQDFVIEVMSFEVNSGTFI